MKYFDTGCGRSQLQSICVKIQKPIFRRKCVFIEVKQSKLNGFARFLRTLFDYLFQIKRVEQKKVKRLNQKCDKTK